MKYICLFLLIALVQGQIVYGPIEGKVFFYGTDGQVSWEGFYKNGIRVGEWKNYYKSGRVKLKFSYSQIGLLEGSRIEYYENGQAKEIFHYENGKKNGEWMTYYENSLIKSTAVFKDGWLEGEKISYYEDTKAKYNNVGSKIKEKINFVNNRKDGLAVFYYESGQVERKEFYK